MPAAKSLAQHVRDGTFRSRNHRDLLVGAVLPWPELAAIQARFAATDHPLERREIGIEFERAMRRLNEDGDEARRRAAAEAELQAIVKGEPEEVDIDELTAALDPGPLWTNPDQIEAPLGDVAPREASEEPEPTAVGRYRCRVERYRRRYAARVDAALAGQVTAQLEAAGATEVEVHELGDRFELSFTVEAATTDHADRDARLALAAITLDGLGLVSVRPAA